MKCGTQQAVLDWGADWATHHALNPLQVGRVPGKAVAEPDRHADKQGPLDPLQGGPGSMSDCQRGDQLHGKRTSRVVLERCIAWYIARVCMCHEYTCSAWVQWPLTPVMSNLLPEALGHERRCSYGLLHCVFMPAVASLRVSGYPQRAHVSCSSAHPLISVVHTALWLALAGVGRCGDRCSSLCSRSASRCCPWPVGLDM